MKDSNFGIRDAVTTATTNEEMGTKANGYTYEKEKKDSNYSNMYGSFRTIMSNECKREGAPLEPKNDEDKKKHPEYFYTRAELKSNVIDKLEVTRDGKNSKDGYQSIELSKDGTTTEGTKKTYKEIKLDNYDSLHVVDFKPFSYYSQSVQDGKIQYYRYTVAYRFFCLDDIETAVLMKKVNYVNITNDYEKYKRGEMSVDELTGEIEQIDTESEGLVEDRRDEATDDLVEKLKSLVTFGSTVTDDARTPVEFKNVLNDTKFYTDIEDLNSEDADKVEKAAGKIVAVITNIGIVLSILIPSILGIKYMVGSADEKAEYKKGMVPYLVGATLLFGICTFVKILQALGNQINNI